MKTKHPEFIVRLRCLPVDHGDQDGIRRLRAFLKCAIRSWRIQCVALRAARPDEVGAEIVEFKNTEGEE